MQQIFYIAFGWVLGLFSPTIVEWTRSYFRKREVAAAICVELEDLQFRLAITSFLIKQRSGRMDREFLLWLRPVVENYAGDEPNPFGRGELGGLISSDNDAFDQLAQVFRAPEGVGLSLKTYRASFLESHLVEISKMSVSLQRKIHEFRNQLDVLNQEILKTSDYTMMTFRPDIGEFNHKRIVEELESKYRFVEKRCMIGADKIGAILSELRPK